MPGRLEDLYRKDTLAFEPETSPPKLARARPVSRPEPKPLAARIIASLLDPVVLQRLLMVGGGLIVIGLVITLASQGVFDNPWVAAGAMTTGSMLVIAGGWGLLLRTKHHIAGIALTFLGCVVLPLNLWFFHAQDLIRVDQHLWVCGLICVAVYAATVFYLRRPVFLYAVQLGVLLTTLLLLGQIDRWNHLNWISTVLAIAGVITMLLPFALPSGDSDEFDRGRFGPPLQIGGHVQLILGLIVLAFVQLFGYHMPINDVFQSAGILWQDNIVWLSAIWLLGSATYCGTAFVRKQSAWIIPAVLCLIATSCQWLELTTWDTPWRLLVIAIFGGATLVGSRFLSRWNDDFGLSHMLGRVGLVIVVVCQAGLAMRAFMMMGVFEPLGEKVLPLGIGTLGLFALMPFSSKNGRSALLATAIAQFVVAGILISFYSEIPIPRKMEIFALVLGLFCIIIGTASQMREADDRPADGTTMVLWFGSLCLGITLIVWGFMARFGHVLASGWDEPVLLIGSMLLTVVGIVSRVKATTITGITALSVYLVTLVGTLLHEADLAAGIYLGVGGAVIFIGAIVLSLFRERLLHLPERISKREGIFQFLNWR